jgi:hypothetical protein
MTYNVGYFPKNLSLQFHPLYCHSDMVIQRFFFFLSSLSLPSKEFLCQIEAMLHFCALNSERKIKPKPFLLRLPLPKLGPLPPGITEINRAQTTRKAKGRHVKLARNTKTESTQTTRIFVFLFPRFAFSARIVSTHREENKIKTDRTSTFPIGFIPFFTPITLNADLRSTCPIRNVLRVANGLK